MRIERERDSASSGLLCDRHIWQEENVTIAGTCLSLAMMSLTASRFEFSQLYSQLFLPCVMVSLLVLFPPSCSKRIQVRKIPWVCLARLCPWQSLTFSLPICFHHSCHHVSLFPFIFPWVSIGFSITEGFLCLNCKWVFLWSLWPSRKWQSKKVHQGFEANHFIVFTGGGEVSIHSFYARSQECTGQGFDQHWWSPSAHFCLPSCSALNTWYWPLWYPTTYLSSSLGILQSQYPSFLFALEQSCRVKGWYH